MPRNSAAGARSGDGAGGSDAHRAPWRMEVRGLRIATQRRRNKCGIAAVMNAIQGCVPRNLLQSWALDTNMVRMETLVARLRQVMHAAGASPFIVPVPPEGVKWQNNTFTAGGRYVIGYVYVQDPYAPTGDSHFKCKMFFAGLDGVLTVVGMDSAEQAVAHGLTVSVLTEGSTALANVKARLDEAAKRVRSTPSTEEAVHFDLGGVALLLSKPGEAYDKFAVHIFEDMDDEDAEGFHRWEPTSGLTYSEPFNVVITRADDGTYIKHIENFSIGGR